jgi:hypothetical protein
MKRILVALTIATVATAVGASAAQAKVVTNETTSYAYSGFVPCANGGAGELVTGTIDAHNLITSTVDGNTESWQFQFQPRGSLVGTTTGDAYQLTGVTRGSYHTNLRSDNDVLTYVNTYHLIGPGPGNNLLVREVAHVTIDGDDAVAQHDDFSIECA